MMGTRKLWMCWQGRLCWNTELPQKYYYYYERIWLKCHKILGVQGHFTIERNVFGIEHNTENCEENCQTQFGPKNCQWCRWGDAGWQAVPYAQSCDRKARSPMVEWRIDVWRVSTLTLTSTAVASLCPPLCGVHRQDMAEPSNADNSTWALPQFEINPLQLLICSADCLVLRSAASWTLDLYIDVYQPLKAKIWNYLYLHTVLHYCMASSLPDKEDDDDDDASVSELFTKQYKLVPAKGRWCLAAGE